MQQGASRSTDDTPHEVALFVAGDPATHKCVERWAAEIVHFKYCWIPSEDRRDVVRDTIAAVWRVAAAGRLDPERGFRAFVRRVAMARCVDYLRRRRSFVSMDDVTLESRALTPYDRALRRDRSRQLRWEIRGLGETCRDLVRLHFLDDLPYATIAERMHRTTGALRVKMMACLKELHDRLERWDEAR